ncbi:MAG: hypothetical protein QF915_03130 [Candidatus Woesearchaeota archaeon]|jgi:uncharacterized membrane protein HdeD (DUF308 family)|nr:hypothetical protein [Candidatus Woesearchaeota archaeon]
MEKGCTGNAMKCHGCILLVVGILIILNETYSIVNWAMFVGIIAVILGAKKLYFASACEGSDKKK